MSFSRTNRLDRRRRVILDNIASDPDYAVESVKAKKRLRARELEAERDEYGNKPTYRDPGYSQEVRRACQQRIVQLIPVKRGTLSLVLSCIWILWFGLVFSHYFLFVRTTPQTSSRGAALPSQPQATNAIQLASATLPTSPELGTAQTLDINPFGKLPIAQLFNLRSSNSIAHWLTCQLWMMIALSAWMIFQLRRHKLDDYRARYRVWVLLAIVAVFSSFDASSSVLYLLGRSIDGWTRREIGYGGWPLVLATFASLIGVLGIRLCNELKSAPGSVTFWIIGMFAWAGSALLGTELIRITWSPPLVDLIVGSLWFGGVLCVFQAAGIYLRQTYVHAQKRFLERAGANLQPLRFAPPKFNNPFKRQPRQESEALSDERDHKQENQENIERRGWRMPWGRRGKPDEFGDEVDDRKAERNDRTTKQNSNKEPDSQQEPSQTKKKLFGFVPNRNELNENLEADPIREDNGPEVDRGLTKTGGWFGLGGNKAKDNAPRPTSAPQAKSGTPLKSEKAVEASSENKQNDVKRSFWRRSKVDESSKTESDSAKAKKQNDAPKLPRKWLPTFGRGKATAVANEIVDGINSFHSSTAGAKSGDKVDIGTEETAKQKRNWLGLGAKRTSDTSKVAAEKEKPKPKEKPAKPEAGTKRGLFGMFDGLKLKPPSDDANANGKSNSSAAPTKPIPIKQGQTLPSTQSDLDDEDDDVTGNGRPMSKAERKRLRRMQGEDRRAA